MKNFGGFGLTGFSPSASFLERFSFLNLSIVPLTKLLCCTVGSSCNILKLRLSHSWRLASLMYFSTSIITTAPPLSALVIIYPFFLQALPLLFVPLWIELVLGFSFFSLLSFCTKWINALTSWWAKCPFLFIFYLRGLFPLIYVRWDSWSELEVW